MKFIKQLQVLSIYIYIFSLNFESINLFDLDISYLATKITISILLIFSLLNFKESFTFKRYPKYIIILVIYFVFLTFNNFINRNEEFSYIINVPFLLNILTFIVLCNYTLVDSNMILKGLLVFSLSTFLLSILYFLGFGGEGLLDGRFTIFGINENRLGTSLCISTFILFSITVENKLSLNSSRILLLLPIPFFLVFMINTGSRLAFISLILGFFIYLLSTKRIIASKKIIVAIFSSFISFFIFFFFLKDSFITTRLIDSMNNGDLSSRDLIWLSIYEVIINNIILGVGETGYFNRMSTVWQDKLPSPHNVFIEIICYTGLIGLSIFSIFLKRIFNNARKINIYENELLPMMLLVLFFGNFLSGHFFDVKLLWLVIAFIASRNYNKSYESILQNESSRNKSKN